MLGKTANKSYQGRKMTRIMKNNHNTSSWEFSWGLGNPTSFTLEGKYLGMFCSIRPHWAVVHREGSIVKLRTKKCNDFSAEIGNRSRTLLLSLSHRFYFSYWVTYNASQPVCPIANITTRIWYTKGHSKSKKPHHALMFLSSYPVGYRSLRQYTPCKMHIQTTEGVAASDFSGGSPPT